MGYRQWGAMLIRNYTRRPLNIRNARLEWGKFYDYPNKDAELKPTDLEKREVKRNEEYTIAACGRESTTSGTEGSFDIFDMERKAFNVYFSVPWSSSKPNECNIRDQDQQWVVKRSVPNGGEGAMGNVTIEVSDA